MSAGPPVLLSYTLFRHQKLVLSVALAHGQSQDKPSIVVSGTVCLNEPVFQFINGFQGQAHSSAVSGSPENKKGRKPKESQTVSSFRIKIKVRQHSDRALSVRLVIFITVFTVRVLYITVSPVQQGETFNLVPVKLEYKRHNEVLTAVCEVHCVLHL